MIDIDIDTSGLESAIEEFAKTTRKSVAKITKENAATLVGHLIALTPPGGRGGEAMNADGRIALDAKKRGEARIAADIRRIFVTTRLPEGAIDRLLLNRDHVWENPVEGGRTVIVHRRVNSLAEAAAIHKHARNPRNGRTRQAGGGLMAIARPALVKDYIKSAIKKVGLLNAGWINAANELKTSSKAVPAWIKRHGAQPGGADVRDSGPMVRIRIFNSQSWFPQGMEARVALAVARREAGLKKAVEEIMDKQARKAEQRMGR